MEIPRRSDGRLVIGQNQPISLTPNADATAPRVTTRKTWTKQEIESLSAEEYKQLMRDPNFVAAMDALVEPPANE